MPTKERVVLGMMPHGEDVWSISVPKEALRVAMFKVAKYGKGQPIQIPMMVEIVEVDIDPAHLLPQHKNV